MRHQQRLNLLLKLGIARRDKALKKEYGKRQAFIRRLAGKLDGEKAGPHQTRRARRLKENILTALQTCLLNL